jgi:cytochrome c oxidase subunit 3
VSLFRKITAKPWEHAGEMAGIHGGSFNSGSTQGTGLKIFLAVISSMFFLFIVSYNLRMEVGDWRPLEDPRVMWVSTVLLVLGSVALQWARGVTKKGDLGRTRVLLTTGGILTLAFLAGQLIAWQQIMAAGFYATVNPSYAFFYLLTGLHGAHLAGGLWVLGRTTVRAWGAEKVSERVQMSVRLCSLYWHYLLLVWLVMFSLLLST